MQIPQFLPPLCNPFNLKTFNAFRLFDSLLVDLDGDGDLDLLATPNNANTPFVYYENIGNLTYSAPVENPFGLQSTLDVYTTLAAADLDGDGDLDLHCSSSCNNDPQHFHWVIINDGDKTNPHFAPPQTNPYGLPLPPDDEYQIAIGDLTGDGLSDLVFGVYDKPSLLYIFQNMGGNPPSFQSVFNGTFEADSNDIALADIDADGHLDLFAYIYTVQNNLYGNTGNFTFPMFNLAQPLVNPFGWVYNTRQVNNGITVGDIDNDGDLDILATSTGGLGCWLFYENTPIILSPTPSFSASSSLIPSLSESASAPTVTSLIPTQTPSPSVIEPSAPLPSISELPQDVEAPASSPALASSSGSISISASVSASVSASISASDSVSESSSDASLPDPPPLNQKAVKTLKPTKTPSHKKHSNHPSDSSKVSVSPIDPTMNLLLIPVLAKLVSSSVSWIWSSARSWYLDSPSKGVAKEAKITKTLEELTQQIQQTIHSLKPNASATKWSIYALEDLLDEIEAKRGYATRSEVESWREDFKHCLSELVFELPTTNNVNPTQLICKRQDLESSSACMAIQCASMQPPPALIADQF